MKGRKLMPRNLLIVLGAAIASMTLSAPIASSSGRTSPALVKALSKGHELMEQGKYEKAIQRLKKAEQLAGEPPVQLLLDLAICFNNVGEFSDSETYARRALEVAQDPADRGRAYNHLGISLFSQSRPFPVPFKAPAPARDFRETLEEAESAFREVLKITAGQASITWYNLAEVLKLRGREDEARTAFVEYLKQSPEGARADQARRAMEWMACAQAVAGSESSSDGPIRVGGDVQRPVKIHAPQPSYTDRARKERIQGTILFEAVIDKNGDVRCLDVVRGLPMGLSEAAAKTVRQWKFEPATLHGEPVVVKLMIRMYFK